MNSGIYIRIGKENKDLITECTTSEFQNWLKSKSPEAYTETIGLEKLLGREDFRLGFLLGIASRYDIIIYTAKQELEAYLASFS